MFYEPWKLAAIDQAGYNGITDAHIDAVAEEILKTGITQVSREKFNAACYRCDVNPNNFTQDDLNALEDRLNI